MNKARAPLLAIVAILAIAALFLVRSRSAPPDTNDTKAATTGEPSVAPAVLPLGDVAPSARPSALGSPAADAPTTKADRAKRDELRRRIYEAFGEPAPNGHDAHRVPTPAEERGIDSDYLARHMREDFAPMARDCVRQAAERDAAVQGTLSMVLHVVGDEKVGGIVESTEIEDGGTVIDPSVLDCLQNSMASLEMPPPEHGGATTIKVPMRFLDHKPDAGAP